MAGFFDRMKDRFTQYAAGTDDLSQLSEAQQKLMRREAIGRLGASLYRNGDFGEAMQQQGEINAKRLEQMQAQKAMERRQQILGTLLPAQQNLASPAGVAPPQVPTLLNPASTNAAPGQPRQLPAQQPAAAGGAPGSQGPNPRDPNQRAQFQQAIIALQAEGDTEGAKHLLDVAQQFAPLETWFAPTEYTDPATGETRLAQFSQLGGQRETGMQAAAPDAVQTLRARMNDPRLNATYLQGRAAGATNVSVNTPFESAFDKTLGQEQAKQFQTFATQAVAAQETLQQTSELRRLLDGVRTGATPELIAEIGKYVGAESATDMAAIRSAAMPFVLSRMQMLGGGDSNEEMRAIQAALPNFGNSPEANKVILDALDRAAQRSISNYQQAVQYVQTPGQRGLTGFIPTVRVPDIAAPPAGGAPPGASRYYEIPGFEPPPAPGGRR